MDLWNIVDGSEKSQPSNAYSKVLQMNCKGVKDLLQHSRDKKFAQHLFHLPQVFMYNMQEGRNLLDPRQQGQSARGSTRLLEVPMREEDIIMTLLKNLMILYEC